MFHQDKESQFLGDLAIKQREEDLLRVGMDF